MVLVMWLDTEIVWSWNVSAKDLCVESLVTSWWHHWVESLGTVT